MYIYIVSVDLILKYYIFNRIKDCVYYLNSRPTLAPLLPVLKYCISAPHHFFYLHFATTHFVSYVKRELSSRKSS